MSTRFKKCPICQELKNLEDFNCSRIKCLRPKYGVFRYFDPEFYKYFDNYEKCFQKIRAQEKIPIRNTSLYNKLPYVSNIDNNSIKEWKGFQEDLKVIHKLIKNTPPSKALNFGSFNGWLSNDLVKKGHEVTAMSYFIDQYDGLASEQFYTNSWISIQMEVEEDLSEITESFDIIVLNRGVAFLNKPEQTIKTLMSKLDQGGILIITGVKIFRNPSVIKDLYQKHLKRYKKQYNFQLEFKSLKGYLDISDKNMLESMGIALIEYPQKFLQNIRARFNHKKPHYYFGVYTK